MDGTSGRGTETGASNEKKNRVVNSWEGPQNFQRCQKTHTNGTPWVGPSDRPLIGRKTVLSCPAQPVATSRALLFLKFESHYASLRAALPNTVINSQSTSSSTDLSAICDLRSEIASPRGYTESNLREWVASFNQRDRQMARMPRPSTPCTISSLATQGLEHI